MNSWKKVRFLPTSIGLIVLNLACGGQAYTPQPTATSSTSSGSSTTTATVPALTTTAPISSISSVGTDPVISKSFTLQGTRGNTNNYPFSPNYATSATFSNISADVKLSVQLLTYSVSNMLQAQYLGSGSNSANYTGCTITSDCMQVMVQLFDSSTKLQIGPNAYVSANTSSTAGTGTCGSSTAQPTYDFSSYLTSGHGPINIVVSQASSDVLSNSCAGGSIYNHDLQLLYYTYEESGTLRVATDTTAGLN